MLIVFEQNAVSLLETTLNLFKICSIAILISIEDLKFIGKTILNSEKISRHVRKFNLFVIRKCV